MVRIKLTISPQLSKKIIIKAAKLGIKPQQYIMTLVVTDLKRDELG